MSNDNKNAMDTSAYHFDPAYGYSLNQLLNVEPPNEPTDFDKFWQSRYQNALTLAPQPRTQIIDKNKLGWQVFEINYYSTDDFSIRGWLLLPVAGVIKCGFIVGHGYGGRDGPDFNLPFKEAALLFPCFRGLGLSKHPTISSDPYWHVRHNIDQVDRYILGGCVEDLWLAVSAMLELFPTIAGHLGYLGISFSGGVGALGLAWEQRISRGHINVPSFGHHPLRLRLESLGSAHSIQQYYRNHKKHTLKVLRYYDAALAAKRITMPMHCACAVFDPCVAPPGQFAIFNALPKKKQLFILEAGHHSYPNQHKQDKALIDELELFFRPL
jgi:cephalosporin-C deacetylase